MKNIICEIMCGLFCIAVFLAVVVGFNAFDRWYGDRQNMIKYEPKD